MLEIEPLDANAMRPNEHLLMDRKDARHLRHLEENMFFRDAVPISHPIESSNVDSLGRRNHVRDLGRAWNQLELDHRVA